VRVSAIIVAAGSGTRLGLATPKAFVEINGISLLRRTMQAVGQVGGLIEAVIAVPPGMEQPAREESAAAALHVPVKIVHGGRERQDSVRAALELTSAESEWIAVHDAARPFATPELFNKCIAGAARVGAAIVALPLADTLKRVEGRTISATVPRAGLWQAQTPQVFHRELLITAHQEALRRSILATDDADLVERLGVRIEVVEGSALNLKITTPDDLGIAGAIARLLSPR
jgi:2-C-methyl-D-erythritol 4-phosphate cytidylyltransferase / 2-C-methyl-D-erythritol 2,4-cyclodiphosphate synthase